MRNLLVIDEEVGSRVSLQAILGTDYTVTSAASLDEGMDALSSLPVDLILLGIRASDGDGMPTLNRIRAVRPGIAVIMIGVSNSLRSAIGRLNGEVCECVIKPFTVPEIKRIVSRSLLTTALKQKVDALAPRQEPHTRPRVLAAQQGLAPVLAQLEEFAASGGPLHITGEIGTGRRALAKYAHAVSRSDAEPFVVVNAATVPDDECRIILFGRAAQDGASRPTPGAWERAGTGTLYIHDAERLPDDVQSELGEAIKRDAISRVGDGVLVPTSARIILGTNTRNGRLHASLRDAMSERRILVPALRERIDDVSDLAVHLMEDWALQHGATVAVFSEDAHVAMRGYAWPGNAEELRNLVERLRMVSPERELIHAEDLPPEFWGRPDALPLQDGLCLEEAVSRYEKALIEHALNETGGIQTQAAERLGTTRRILRYRMDKLKIRIGKSRGGCA